MELYYKSSDGTVIDFNSNGIYAQDPESLLENKWQYTSITGANDFIKIKSFFKDVEEHPLLLSIVADTAAAFNAKMLSMLKAFERDVITLTPGRIYWNGFYKECFIFASAYSEFDEFLEAVEKEVTVVSTSGFWTKETTKSFSPVEPEEGDLDYPYDYPHDLAAGYVVDEIVNDCVVDCDFRLVLHGGVMPCIIVNGHRYKMQAACESGEKYVITSRDKKIKLISQGGSESNAFYLRENRDYIFEKLPSGTLHILRPNDLAYDLTLIDGRSEPEWI